MIIFRTTEQIYCHLRIPHELHYHRRYTFTWEECFPQYLVFNRIGETKLRMSRNYFGGDSRRFIYSIRIMNQNLYEMFYNKISGDLIRIWKPQIDEFRLAIWLKLNDGYVVEERCDATAIMQNLTPILLLSIPFTTFCIFEFLGDTEFWSIAPGVVSCRMKECYDDLQRSFYSAYFSGHG